MSASLLKSKLKRRKLSTEGQQANISSSGNLNRSHSAVFCPRKSAEPRRCVSPAAASWWWSRDQLTSVETLWALTLQAALPHLEEQQWQQLPQLPSSVQRPPLLTADEQRWCDLSEEVSPFPEPIRAVWRTSSGPNPTSSSSSSSSSSRSLEQVLSAQTPPKAAVPSNARPHQQEKTTAPQSLLLHEAPQSLLLHEAPQSLLPGGGGGPESAPSTAANRRASSEDASQNEKEVVKEGGPAGREVSVDGATAAAGGGGEGGGLQSCPMCLLEFPTRWSQMERDGHLALCLSEVNVDVTW